MTKTLRALSPALLRPNLSDLADRLGSDKGRIHFEGHQYTRVYEALFSPLRDQPLRILELGLLHSEDRRWRENPWTHFGLARGGAAPSLAMWSEYFRKATIFGFDANDFGSISLPRTTIVQGDVGSDDDLDRLIAVTGGAFDIVIDDASHCSHHQQVALGRLLPAVKPGGLYIIEDLHWQNPLWEPADALKTLDLLRAHAVSDRFNSPYLSAASNHALTQDVACVTLFDSLEPGRVLEARDALAVITKSGRI